MKRLLLLVILIFDFLKIFSQNNNFTIHPVEIFSRSISCKYEHIPVNISRSYGVLLSIYDHSTRLDYSGYKISPFIRFNKYEQNRLGYFQIKLIAGHFSSEVEYSRSSIRSEYDEFFSHYNTFGAGVCGGYQIFCKNNHLSFDFSIGFQYCPQLAEKVIYRGNQKYTLKNWGWFSFMNHNEPWIYFGPGSLIEFKLGIGINSKHI